VVQVASGTYKMSASQTIAFDSSKVNSKLASPCNNADRVVFKKAGPVRSYGDSRDPLFTVPTGSGDGFNIRATCLTFNGLDFDAEINIPSNTGPSDNPSSITFENGRYDHNRGFPSGETGFNVNGNYITFRNIEVGPICCDDDAMDIAGYPSGVSYGVTMDNMYMHDIVTSCSQLSALASWPACPSESTPHNGNHVDCVQTLGMGNWTVENSRVLNCPGGGGANFQQGVLRPNNTYFDVLFENNVVDTENFGMGCGGSCITTYGNQYAFKATVPPGYPNSGTKSYYKLLYNTIQVSAGGSDMQPGGDYEMVGNIMGGLDYRGCVLPVYSSTESQGATWSVADYNMFGDGNAAQCNKYGKGNSNGTPSYVDRAHGNWQLVPGSAGIARGGIGLQPRRDLEGRLRPVRYPADVGAYVSESAAISFDNGRLGGLRLGMSRAAVLASYGNPASVRNARHRAGVLAVARYVRHGGSVWVTYGRRLTVVSLATSSRYFTTPTGLGPGTPLSVLRRLRPQFRPLCQRQAYRRIHGGIAVDLTVPHAKITGVAISRTEVAPTCK
jgi:hypothetical protein